MGAPISSRRKWFCILGLGVPLSCLPSTFGQVNADELAPLLSGIAQNPENLFDLDKRVPLSTNDPTVAPLIDLQVFAPPVVPVGGSRCTLELLRHSFGEGSFNAPAVVRYVPPAFSACGEIGKWATIALNLSVSS